MRTHTPQKDLDVQRRRPSIAGGMRSSIGSSGIPMVQSRIRQARALNSNQPAFDFLTGEPVNRPPSRGFSQSLRLTSGAGGPPHAEESTFETAEEREKRKRELDELKAEIKTLKYTIDNNKQEDELAKLRHENELRDARRKGEEDFSAKQVAEAEKSRLQRQYDSLLKEVTEIKDSSANEKAALERQFRDVQETKRFLEEEIEDLKTEKEESIRSIERKASELEARNESLQTTVQELQQDSDQRESLLQDAQQQVTTRDSTIGNLEAEVLRLKAQTGDQETLDVIKRELSEQVTHIRKLEVVNREQAADLKHFKRLHKSVEVVEEEKRSLQRKLEAVEGLENELGEARIQRQRLEDERLAWTAYLQTQASEDGQLEFETPEALARGLVAERLQTATLFERIGALEPEISVRDSTIQALESENSGLIEELEKVKSSGTSSGNNKTQLRLERQLNLAAKEVEFLRAQLKTYDTEDDTFQPDKVDEIKQQRIQELEELVSSYKKEVQTLTADLASKEPAPALATGSNKRPREESEEESTRIGELTRKKRKLEDELTTVQTSNKLFQKEISVLNERLTAATTQRKTRVLSLRSNPTSDFEAIKLTTLTTLRQENIDLLAQLEGSSDPLTAVPISVLASARIELQAAQRDLASEKKAKDRLLKVWGVKSEEFRDAVRHLFGWDMVFMRDNKVRVTSVLYPSTEDDDDNNIVFDMDKGTMKVSGGPQSDFAAKIADQVRFWLKERESIPCFLAALGLEFFEEVNRDRTIRMG